MYRDALIAAAQSAVRGSSRLNVVIDDQGDHLTLDGVRLGRDLPLYAFMGEVGGDEWAMCHVLEEVVLPLKAALDGLEFAAVSAPFKQLGEAIYAGSMLEDWREFFA